jgi:hypothetical protein
MSVSSSETYETQRATPPLFVIESMWLCWACEGLPPGRFDSQTKNAPGFFETSDEPEREVAAWEEERNERGVEIRWHITTADARIKLRRLGPVL